MSRTGLRPLALTGLAVGAVLLILWASGALAGLEHWAAARQREAQTMMAGALRALRSGQPGATATLLSLCFGYGVVHAVGPGHGKVLIGGYGFGTQVPLLRLAGLSLAASLAQALVAVALVGGGISLLNLSREALTSLTEDRMAQISAIAIGLVGLWLVWRGLAALRRDTHHDHDHDHGSDCGCGHAHGPSPEQAARTHSLRDAAILIAGIAIRPCTGALFLLILTWRMGIFATGIAGALAMGLGTGMVTLVVAALSVWAREGSFALLPSGTAARWLPATMQIGAGALVATLGFALL